MSNRAQTLSKRIADFRDEVIAFVEKLSPQDWHAVSEWENWTVGVVARHLGAGHLAFFKTIGMILQGKELPPWTMDQINEMSNHDAREHADCTKDEALNELRKNGDEFVTMVAGLSDEELDRTCNMPALGGEVSTEKIIELILFNSAQQHFDSIRAAIGR